MLNNTIGISSTESIGRLNDNIIYRYKWSSSASLKSFYFINK